MNLIDIGNLEKIINYAYNDDWYGIEEDERTITTKEFRKAYDDLETLYKITRELGV